MRTVLIYLASGTDRVDSEQLSRAIQKTIGNKGEPLMPTIAQTWIEEGMQKGLQEGREEGLCAGILAVLEIRFPNDHQLISDHITSVGSVKKLEQLLEAAKVVPNISGLKSFLPDQNS